MKGPPQDKKIVNPMGEIKKIQQKRQERRIKMEQAKKQKQEKKAYNLASGKNVDIDFQIMIDKSRFHQKILAPHQSSASMKLSVCVRKRPIFKKEQQNGQIDAISCANPQIKVHEPKYKVDGITKYVQNNTFTFDNTFNEEQTSRHLYQFALKPLIPSLVDNGIVTCFAYGQTGSGKTFTMNELQVFTVEQLFSYTKKTCEVSVSFFQIYAGRCLDLLNQKNVLNILQDKNNNIQIQGLVQKSAGNPKQLLQIMQVANSVRTTHSTIANDTSSRSHAICQVLIKKSGSQIGKLVLVDLAGSERAQDTQSNNRQRRMQGAQINKSLLALKQCIRAMGDKADHIPFRAAKLTLILRDSFISKLNKSKVVMIACISPGSSSADHSLNTLRYADRLKDNSEMHKKFNEIYEKNHKNSIDIQNQFSKDHIQKIQSLKNIAINSKKTQKPKIAQNKSTVQEKIPAVQQKKEQKKPPAQQKKIPPLPNPNIQQPPKLKKEEPKQKKQNRSQSVKKINTSATNLPSISNNNLTNKLQNNVSSKKNTKNLQPATNKSRQKENEEFLEEEMINQEQKIREKQNKKRAKLDINVMKETIKDNKMGQQYFAFQEKVSNILQQQEEVFATHMAAIKQDAKLLTQQSQLISKVQGVGFIDYDIDSYVQKLQAVVKKKLKMYTMLNKKIQGFKKCLNEQEQMRHKVKDTFYF